MKLRIAFLRALFVVSALSACAPAPTPERCEPGIATRCDCTNGSSGIQICTAEGTPGMCMCWEVRDAGPERVVPPQDSRVSTDAIVPDEMPFDAGVVLDEGPEPALPDVQTQPEPGPEPTIIDVVVPDVMAPPDVVLPDVVPPMDVMIAPDVVPPMDANILRTVTLRQLQDIADPAHPPVGSRVTVQDVPLTILTPRMVIGSARPSGAGAFCRFAVWVGRGMGDFSGLEVQEIVPLGTATDCFSLSGRIPTTTMPGATVVQLSDVLYEEACLGATGTSPMACRNFELTALTLNAGSNLVVHLSGGGTPSINTATARELAGIDGAPGPRALGLEGTLVRVANVRSVVTRPDSGFNEYAIVDAVAGAEANAVSLVISNFLTTTCVRSFLEARGTTPIPSVTGILVPNFGRWSLRLRDDRDIEGINCARDGGM